MKHIEPLASLYQLTDRDRSQRPYAQSCGGSDEWLDEVMTVIDTALGPVKDPAVRARLSSEKYYLVHDQLTGIAMDASEVGFKSLQSPQVMMDAELPADLVEQALGDAYQETVRSVVNYDSPPEIFSASHLLVSAMDKVAEGAFTMGRHSATVAVTALEKPDIVTLRGNRIVTHRESAIDRAAARILDLLDQEQPAFTEQQWMVVDTFQTALADELGRTESEGDDDLDVLRFRTVKGVLLDMVFDDNLQD
ncbi:MAG TPA: hypothetical protein VF572_07380 [Candidatus Saccharimonadales bacterium]|jgi:hypothetical protein